MVQHSIRALLLLNRYIHRCMQGQQVIFMETAMQLQDRRSHAVVDCIPVPAGAFAKAPLYFKKEIEEAESEWSQHHAKRLIDTRAKVGSSAHDLADGLVVPWQVGEDQWPWKVD